MKKSQTYLKWQIPCFFAFPLTALTLLLFSTTAFGAEWYVSKAGGDFTTIQSAIDAVTTVDGDTILVADGTYQENVVVGKSLIIRSEHGYSSTTVEAANSKYPGFTVTANEVTIKGFTVYGTTGNQSADAGIYLYNYTQHCTIANNRCGYDADHHNSYGISVNHSGPYHNITGNICNSNTYYGIWLNNSNDGTILGNICFNNGRGGIGLYQVSNITVFGNICDSNTIWGIDMNSESCTVSGNTWSENQVGIQLSSGNNNTLYLNNFNSNGTNVNSTSTNNNWSSPTKINYVYMGSLHTSYLGNFYSDHDLLDFDEDGVTDDPYVLGGNEPDDEYPLAAASGNYSIVVLPFLEGDFDRNGDVDGTDLAVFAENFGKTY